jgi:hypothetical protein
MCNWGPIYRDSYTWSLQYPYCPRSPTLVYHCAVMGSLQSFVIYKYFRAPPLGMWHVSPALWCWRQRPLVYWWPSALSVIALMLLLWSWPSVPPFALRALCPIRPCPDPNRAEAPPCSQLHLQKMWRYVANIIMKRRFTTEGGAMVWGISMAFSLHPQQ